MRQIDCLLYYLTLKMPIKFNLLLLSLTLIQVNISNPKLDQFLNENWQSQDEQKQFHISNLLRLVKIMSLANVRWFEINRDCLLFMNCNRLADVFLRFSPLVYIHPIIRYKKILRWQNESKLQTPLKGDPCCSKLYFL